MIKWVTAFIFSILVHVGIFFGYTIFSSEQTETTKRKITNVNFLDKPAIQEVEIKKTTIAESKADISTESNEAPEEVKKEIKNLDEYLEQEDMQNKNDFALDIVEQISAKVIKDIESLWIRPNNTSKGMFVDFNLRLNRVGLIENIEMKRSSGDETFDRAALNAIRKYKRINYIKNVDDEVFQSYFANFTLRFKPL